MARVAPIDRQVAEISMHAWESEGTLILLDFSLLLLPKSMQRLLEKRRRSAARQQRISAGAARGTTSSTRPIWVCRRSSLCSLWPFSARTEARRKEHLAQEDPLPPSLTFPLGIHSCCPGAVNKFIFPNTIPTPILGPAIAQGSC